MYYPMSVDNYVMIILFVRLFVCECVCVCLQNIQGILYLRMSNFYSYKGPSLFYPQKNRLGVVQGLNNQLYVISK